MWRQLALLRWVRQRRDSRMVPRTRHAQVSQAPRALRQLHRRATSLGAPTGLTRVARLPLPNGASKAGAFRATGPQEAPVVHNQRQRTMAGTPSVPRDATRAALTDGVRVSGADAGVALPASGVAAAPLRAQGGRGAVAPLPRVRRAGLGRAETATAAAGGGVGVPAKGAVGQRAVVVAAEPPLGPSSAARGRGVVPEVAGGVAGHPSPPRRAEKVGAGPRVHHAVREFGRRDDGRGPFYAGVPRVPRDPRRMGPASAPRLHAPVEPKGPRAPGRGRAGARAETRSGHPPLTWATSRLALRLLPRRYCNWLHAWERRWRPKKRRRRR